MKVAKSLYEQFCCTLSHIQFACHYKTINAHFKTCVVGMPPLSGSRTYTPLKGNIYKYATYLQAYNSISRTTTFLPPPKKKK